MRAKQKSYKLVKAFSHQTSGASSVDFYSRMVAVSTREGVISVVDVEEGEVTRTHHCFKYGVNCMRYFHSSEVCAVASAAEGPDAGIWRLWDLHANKFSAVFRGHDRPVGNLEVHALADVIISSCEEFSIFWDVRADKVISKFTDFRSSPIFEKTQGRYFVAAVEEAKNKSIVLYDIRNFDKPFTNFRFPDIQGNINEIAISPDGNLLALTLDDRVMTVDVNRGVLLARSAVLCSPKKPSFNWSSDLLAVSVDSKDVLLLKVAGLERLQQISDHQGPASSLFSPTRDLLVTAATGIGLWCPLS